MTLPRTDTDAATVRSNGWAGRLRGVVGLPPSLGVSRGPGADVNATGAARTGTITISGQVFAIDQAKS